MQKNIQSISSLFLLSFVFSLSFPSVLANSDTMRVYFTDFPQGSIQNKYTLDLTLVTQSPLQYTFDIISYERSYKYGGVIKWKPYPTFPHGEGTMTEIIRTGTMNITGWLGDTTFPNLFFGLMSVPDLTSNQTLYWIVGKEQNPAQVMYGTYWINTTYFP